MTLALGRKSGHARITLRNFDSANLTKIVTALMFCGHEFAAWLRKTPPGVTSDY